MQRKSKAAAGQTPRARKSQKTIADAAAPLSMNDDGAGHSTVANQFPSAPSSSANASVPAIVEVPFGQRNIADSLAPIIAEIRAWHRRRVFAMDQRKRADLALGAFLRTQLGWSRALPKAEADKIRKRAADLMAMGEKVAAGKGAPVDPVFSEYAPDIIASIMSRQHLDARESAATKEMERLARSLPVWEAFGEAIKGFGPRSLAVIVGEAGDLSLYANPAKLWKRMGLAVMSGVRQGGLRKTASAEDWIAHGYSAKRRSFMFVIGDVLIKNQNTYRDVYLERKEFERAKAKAAGLTVAPAAKIPEKRKAEFMSDGHVHRRAQRYMEKRLLKNLWQAWRRADAQVPSRFDLPAATSSAQAERSAPEAASPIAQMPSAETSQTIYHAKSIQRVSGKRRAMDQESSVRKLPAAESNRQTNPPMAPSGAVSASRSAIPLAPPMAQLPSAPFPAKAGKRRAVLMLEAVGGVPAAISSAKAGRSADVAQSPSVTMSSEFIPGMAGRHDA